MQARHYSAEAEDAYFELVKLLTKTTLVNENRENLYSCESLHLISINRNGGNEQVGGMSEMLEKKRRILCIF